MSKITHETPVADILNHKTDDRRFAAIPFEFKDLWAEDENKREVTLNFRFAKPTKTQIKRVQDTAGRNSAQAARDLLISTIHPDDKDALLTSMDDYPGIATSYSTALLKAVGISADVGN